MWEECQANPKNKGKTKPKTTFKSADKPKAAAMNTDVKVIYISTDSDTEMDRYQLEN